MKTRYNITFTKYSRYERLRMWIRNIRFAILESPPTQKSVFVPLNPGDPGYEGAFFEVGFVERPMRFERPIK